MYVQRTDKEIDDVVNEAIERGDDGHSRFPGMSYEDGIRSF